jgi:hypothetical protein
MRRDTYVEQHKNGPKQGKCTHTGLKIPSLLDFIYISSMIEKLKGLNKCPSDVQIISNKFHKLCRVVIH